MIIVGQGDVKEHRVKKHDDSKGNLPPRCSILGGINLLVGEMRSYRKVHRIHLSYIELCIYCCQPNSTWFSLAIGALHF